MDSLMHVGVKQEKPYMYLIKLDMYKDKRVA